MTRIVTGLGWLAQRVVASWPRLRLSRVAFLSFLFGALMLTVPEQTRDLMAELPDDDLARDAFLFGVFAWCFVLWFWARWALNLECGVDPDTDHAAEAQGERLWWLSALLVVAVLAAAWRITDALGWPNALALLPTLAGLGLVAAWWQARPDPSPTDAHAPDPPPANPQATAPRRHWDAQAPRVLAMLAAVAAAVAAWRSSGLLSLPTLGAVGVGALVLLLTSFRRRLTLFARGSRGAWTLAAIGVLILGAALQSAWWSGRIESWATIRAALVLGIVVAVAAAWTRASAGHAPLAWLAPDARWAQQVAALRQQAGLPAQGGIPDRPGRRRPGGADVHAAYYQGASWVGRLLRDLDAAPLGRVFALLLIAGALAFCATVWIAPATTAPWIGAAATAMLALAAIATLASVLVHFIGRHTGLPVITLLLVLGFLGVEIGADNHDVRMLDRIEKARPTLRQALRGWLDACAPAPDAHEGVDPPTSVVLLATAGGASRAALWTGTVLDALAAADPALHTRLAGISSVSGGSLGAAVWTALAAEAGVDCRTPPIDLRQNERSARFRGFIDQDHLAPAMAGFLATDPLWFFGMPATWIVAAATPWRAPDRAAALEASFEQAWTRVTRVAHGPTPPNRLAASLHDLWRQDGDWAWRRPLLFLNGTHQETGLPIVTAPARFALPDALASHDFVNLTGRDLRLSSAVTNSARFPYITPSGGVRSADRMRHGNIVDGGYFDNQGSATLTDVAAALVGIAREMSPLRRLRIMVVQVSSDPDRRDGELLRCAGLTENERDPKPGEPGEQRDRALRALEKVGRTPSGLDSMFAPVFAVAATQSAHTVRSAVNLARVFCADSAVVRPPPGVETDFTHFILRRDTATIPLNWVLPQTAQAYIAERAMERCHMDEGRRRCPNAEELERFRAWATAGSPIPPPPPTPARTAAAPAPDR